MKHPVCDKENSPSYPWGNQCTGWILTDQPGLSVKQEYMPGGAREVLHSHERVQQFFFILKGSAAFYLDGELFNVKKHKGICIVPGVKHFIVNETDQPLEFLVTSQPSTDDDRKEWE